MSLLGTGQITITDVTDTVLIYLSADTSVIQKSASGVFTPSTVTFSAFAKEGASLPYSYSGKFVILTSTDGLNFTISYQSGSNEAVVTVTVLPNTKLIKAILYDSITSNVQVDELGLTAVDVAAGSTNTGVARLYKYDTTVPTLNPTGSALFTWATGVHSGYTGGNGWSIAVPANPGFSNTKLYMAERPLSADSGTVSTTVDWSTGYTVGQISANGESPPGTRFAIARAYIWDVGTAPTAAGSSTYTWSTGNYTNVPSGGWAATSGAPPGAGYSLYQVEVKLIDASTSTTSNFDWATGQVSVIGSSGFEGASARIAYAKSTSSSLSTLSTYTTSGGISVLPATNTWGGAEVWANNPPVPVAGEWVFQVYGIYNKDTGITNWGVPFVATFKVGSLSALSANLGTITAGDISIGSGGVFTVDSSGNVVAKSIIIKNSTGQTILQSGSPIDWTKLGGASSNLLALGYTGALNATNGATIGTNLSGQITAANASTFIASAAIGAAQIGSLNAGIINAGTINAARIAVGTATAAASSSYGGSVVQAAPTATFLALYVGNTLSLNSTGSPVTINGYLSIRFVSANTTHSYYRIFIDVYYSSAIASFDIFVPANLVSGMSRADLLVPFARRYTEAAGVKTIGYNVEVNAYNATNTLLAMGSNSTLEVFSTFTMQENKI